MDIVSRMCKSFRIHFVYIVDTIHVHVILWRFCAYSWEFPLFYLTFDWDETIIWNTVHVGLKTGDKGATSKLATVERWCVCICRVCLPQSISRNN